ncbi:MAG: hypothetical protein ACR2JC_12440 [Chloroflexota bacterium]|nr:MAG: hypothetical protein DLM70_05020 [Chloroflexota bacterium]
MHPHILFSVAHFGLDLIGPDGRLYGSIFRNNQAQDVALDSQGHVKTTFPLSPGLRSLLPNGTLLAAGGDEGRIHGFGSDGAPLWTDANVGLFKSAVPLAANDNTFYAPFVGHAFDHTSGLDMVAASGSIIRRIEPGIPTFAVSLASNGTIYAILQTSTSNQDSLQAFTPEGSRLWKRHLGFLPFQYGGCKCPIVGESSEVYVSDGQRVLAYRPNGHLAWRYGVAGGAASMALRSDGVLLVAGSHDLNALSREEKMLWRLRLSKRADEWAAALIVDRRGTAYVEGSDGQVRVVSNTGKILVRLKTGGSHIGPVPKLGLSPNGDLVVAGTDGTTRVYG